MANNDVKNIGFHIFDPVLNFMSSHIKNNKLLDILNSAIELSKTIKIKRQVPEYKYLEINKSHEKKSSISEEMIKKIRDDIIELLDIINELYKNEVILYNLIYGVSEFIKEKKLSEFIENSDDIIDYLADPNVKLQVDIDFINKFKLSNFKKISYNEYKIDNLESLSIDKLENITIELSDEIEILYNNILYLIDLSEQFKNRDNTKSQEIEINMPSIPSIQIQPVRQSGSTLEIQAGGNKIDEVMQLLNKLKNNIEGVSSLTVEKEIPGGINLELDVIKKILTDFKINLELQAKPGNDPDETKYTKKWEYNLFEEIPDYKTIKYDISKKFLTNPLTPTIPQESDKVLDSNDLIKIINDKEAYIDKKIIDIKDIVGDIILFTKKLQDYKTKELNKVSKYNYTFTNIGEKADLEKRKIELNILIEQKKIELDNKKKLKEFLNDTNFSTYLKKKEEFINRPISNEEEEYKQLITLMFEYVSNTPFDSDGNIDNQIKRALDHMMEIRPKMKYELGFFLDDKNYRKYDMVKQYLESFKNAAPEVQKSQMGRKDSSIDPDFFKNLFTKFQQSIVPSRNEKYAKVIDKLDEMDRKYNKKDELKEYIDNTEKNIPLYLENYTVYKSDTEFDMTQIDESIENKKISIDQIISSIEEEIKFNEKESKNVEPLLKNYKENTDYEDMITIDSNLFRIKIELLHKKLLQINESIKIIFNLKDGIDDINKLNMIENNIINTQDKIRVNWFLNQTGGTNYIFNIENINKINDINDAMKKLLIKTEKYKFISTDLLENYVIFIKNIHSVIIYIYYRLTVLQDLKNTNFRITRKFNENSLEQLKRNISSIKRKNFDLIKEYYLEVVNDLLDKQNKLKNNNKEYKYIKFDNTIKDNNGLLNLFILAHIESYIDKY